MNDQGTAEIIAFPARSRPSEMAQSTERLATALSGLSVALAEQGDALRRWRDALQTLSARIDQIGPREG